MEALSQQSGLCEGWGCLQTCWQTFDWLPVPPAQACPCLAQSPEEKPELLQDGGFLWLPKVPVPF
jgi:hypothetical protein